MSITRIDHLVIAVRDVPAGREVYETRLGFTAYAGGRHTGLGTENAIVRFGLDYLELLGIYDEAEVAAAPRRASLVDYFAQHQDGLLGFCMATDDIEAMAARFQRLGLDAEGPFDMKRMRPDGVLLEWRLLIPGGTAWRKPWPFIIQWGLDDAARLQYETPGEHANRAQRISGVVVLVRDLDAAHYLYAEQLGLGPGERQAVPGWNADQLVFTVNDFQIHVVAPRDTDNDDGPLPRALAEEGVGLYAALLQVRQLEHARELLQTQQVNVAEWEGLPIGSASGLVVSGPNALGARLVLHE
jgi:catechol 2,3-dioxygenase-like lactoylglutathione lyase family enzyme